MKHNRTSNYILRSGVIGLALLATMTSAEASSTGIVGLFMTEDPAGYDQALSTIEATTSPMGCTVSRHGVVMGEAGDIGANQPNRFLVLTCEETLLDNPKGREVFQNIRAVSENSIILEGELASFSEDNSTSDIAGRDYILKVSHYNNVSPDSREHDLANLRAESLSLADRYRRELFIAVDRAIGIETPDEVALLFYDDPAQGERFRDNNPEILGRIGAFNENHLNDYIYYSAAAIR